MGQKIVLTCDGSVLIIHPIMSNGGPNINIECSDVLARKYLGMLVPGSWFLVYNPNTNL